MDSLANLGTWYSAQNPQGLNASTGGATGGGFWSTVGGVVSNPAFWQVVNTGVGAIATAAGSNTGYRYDPQSGQIIPYVINTGGTQQQSSGISENTMLMGGLGLLAVLLLKK